MMAKKHSSWESPIDSRLIPNIFSFRYPKSAWVRLFIAIEMTLAVLVVIGTLLLAILSPGAIAPSDTTSTAPKNSQY